MDICTEQGLTIKFSRAPEGLFFLSVKDWQTFCQEVAGIVPVYLWNGRYIVISEMISRSGNHGAVRLGEGRSAETHYYTPAGKLSHHWEAFYGRRGGSSVHCWRFEAGELPQEVARGEKCWLKSYRQSNTPGIYEAVTKDGVLYPVGVEPNA
jgi:hypothetical protein